MAELLSAGLEVTETDNTSYTPGTGMTTGVTVGKFKWGAINKASFVANEGEVVDKFGRPVIGYNTSDFYTAVNYLSKSKSLYIARAGNINSFSATSIYDPITCKATAGTASAINSFYNEDEFDVKGVSSTDTIVARYPGDIANGLKVVMIDASNYSSANEYNSIFNKSGKQSAKYVSSFSTIPNSSDSAILKSGLDNPLDEIHILVIDELGKFKTAGTILEKWELLSKCQGSRNSDNERAYFIDVINDNSKFIYIPSSFSIKTTPTDNKITDITNDSYNGFNTVPAKSSTSKFSVTTQTGIAGAPSTINTFKTYAEFLANKAAATDTVIARYPGQLANGIQVVILDSSNYASNTAYHNLFPTAPASSASGIVESALAAPLDEVHIAVIDTLGTVKSVGAVLETYTALSKCPTATTGLGVSNYFIDVINTKSNYVYIPNTFVINGAGDHISDIDSVTLTEYAEFSATSTPTFTLSGGDDGVQCAVFSLSGGADGNITTGDLQVALEVFDNPDEINYTLMLNGDNGSILANDMINIATNRKDAVVLITPPLSMGGKDMRNGKSDALAICKEFRQLLPSTSYAFMDSNWKLMYDKYNDKNIWIPLNGDIGAAIVNTTNLKDPWWSPAGFNRGQILNAIRLAWIQDSTSRDELYINGINPCTTVDGEMILYGDKTLLSKPSAFDRINVRLLFIYLEVAIKRAAKYNLFEFNDVSTRISFINSTERFLETVRTGRGCTAYMIKCDDTNNTTEVIQSKQFVGEVFIKPNYSINYIKLNFVAANNDATFTIG